MTRFNNLRLAQRLGVAFGAMILALVVISALSVAKITRAGRRRERAERPRASSASRTPSRSRPPSRTHRPSATSHLYVHDGDLAAQDKIAAQIATVRSAGNASVAACASRPTTRASRRSSTACVHPCAVRRRLHQGRAPLTRRDRAQRRGSQRLARFLRQRGRPGRTAAHEGRRRAWSPRSAARSSSPRPPTTAPRPAARRTIIVVALLTILVAVGLAFLVVRSVVNPLKVVVERMAMLRDICIAGLQEGIAAMATGDLTKDVVPQTPPIENPAADEVGDVARAFNEIHTKTVESIGGYNATRAQLGELVGKVSSSAQSLSAALAADGDDLRGGRSRRRRDRVGRRRGRSGRRAPGARRRAGEARRPRRSPRPAPQVRRTRRRPPTRPSRRARSPSRAPAPWRRRRRR